MSIFKRLFGDRDDGNNNGNSSHLFRPNINNTKIKCIGSNLQKRFSRGVQYNMKIVIRGDRNVGKSALLARLKGLEFCDQYIPTDEIEVACVHWNYKSTDDVIKVEVWDVVDKGRKKKQFGLKFENNSAMEENSKSICLDAEFLDVYKGAHAVIMVLDITKSWTLNYVERELPCVPEDIPILVLANHRDMGHHRTVNTDQIQTLVESTAGFKKGIVKYWESSMKNGFGLIYIHRFFNIPFLQLQRDTMLKQLATNEKETSLAFQELEELEEDPHKMYDSFIANLKQSKINSYNSHKPSSLSLHSNPVSQINSPITPGTNSIPPHKMSLTPMTDCSASVMTDRAVIHPPQARPIPGMEKLGLYPLPVPTDTKIPTQELNVIPNPVESKYSNNSNNDNIEEFVPDEHPELSSFLDEVIPGRSLDTKDNIDSSSDDNDYNANRVTAIQKQNPMVASFQDDIEIDDMPHADDNSAFVNPSYHNDSASSDDDKKYKLATGPLDRVKKRSDTTLPSEFISVPVLETSKVNIIDMVTLPVKDEDTDDITVHSNSSTKKKKKHHKDSANKDSRRKKKKSKGKSKDDSSDGVLKSSPPSNRKGSQSSRKSCSSVGIINSVQISLEPVFNQDRSDSLERFLND